MTHSEQRASLLTVITLVVMAVGWILTPDITPKSQTSTTADKAITEALQLLALAPPVPEVLPTPETIQPEPLTPEPVQVEVPPTPMPPSPVQEAPSPLAQAKPKSKPIAAKPSVKVSPVVAPVTTQVTPSAVVATPPAMPTPLPVSQVDPQVALDAAKTYRVLLLDILGKHKEYPRLSRRLAEEGVVRVRFTVAANGKVSELELVNGSGYERLDLATLAIFEQLNMQLPAFLEGMTQTPLQFELPVRYQLSAP
jgi:protein TonB